jgi:hypothetical protein
MKEGLLLALSMGCNRIILSSDCMDAVKAINEGGSSGTVAAIFDECYHLATEFPIVVFEHSHREANSMAHELARLAKCSPECVWRDGPPTSIRSLLLADVTIISDK